MKWRNDFKTQSSKQDVYYDIIDDYDLIESSFMKQYGIRLRTDNLTADEFNSYLCGLMGDTPLGAVINIRSENDPDILKNFTPEQKKIRREWQKRKAFDIDKNSYNNMMKNLEEMFKSMSS